MSDLLPRLQEALLGTYAVERELGRGGMATVFLARDLKHDRAVAVKVLHPELAAAVGADRFRREIRIETRLAHPNILPIYDSGEADGLLFYVMPFIAGESLRLRMTRERQLPIDDAIRITCEVAEALDYAHRHGLIHRDIKPENILLEDGHAIVADFGIARAVSAGTDQQKLTESGVTLGTPLYMSPEQAMGERDLDGRSDQYSLACVLYEMLAGDPPFRGQSAHALIARHVLDPVPSLLTVRDTVPDDVETAITCALAKVPADRFATVAAFSAALRGTGTFPVNRRSTLGRTGTRPIPRAPRRRALISLAIAVGALAAAGATWQLWGPQTGAASAGTIGLDQRRLAVLYLTDESRDGGLSHLADGLTEALIEELSKVNALQVISPNGVAPFRGSSARLDSIAAELNAGTLVRGSVEPTGAGIRVTVRLVDGNSGVEIQRAAFERAAGDMLSMRDTVTQQVADFLRRQLGRDIALKETRAGTHSVDAWLLVQRAERARKDAQLKLRVDSAEVAEQLFAQADSLLSGAEAADPEWVAPIAQRAYLAIQRSRVARNSADRAGLIEEGLDHSRRALQRDPRNAAAFEYRGTLRLFKILFGIEPLATQARLGRLAEEDLQQAVTLDKSRASAWNTLSYVQYLDHRKVEANLSAQRAYETDAYLASAREIIWRLYTTSYDIEQFAAASKWCDLGRTRFPQDPVFSQCELWMMTTRAEPPDISAAWRVLSEIEQKMAPSQWEAERAALRMLVAVPIARAGLLDSAQRVIARARVDSPHDPSGELVGHEAVVQILIGEKDEALRLLRLYLTSHPDHREGFARGNAWWWRPLQEDPRFKTLMGADG